jgi:hypothetical protein
MTQTNTIIPSPADRKLEHFVFAPDRFESEKIPRRLRPEQVNLYIRMRILPTTPVMPLKQAGKVIDYYDVYELCEYFRKMLDRREQGPADVVKSAIIDSIIARVGNPSDHEFARLYYEYLVGRATTVQEYEELVDLFESLGPGTNATPLRKSMQKRLAAIEPQRQADFKMELEFHKLQELGARLDRAEKANAVKNKMLTNPDRAARIAEEVRTHLGLANGYPEYLRTWSARRLRRETWAEKPPQQFTRDNQPPLREQVVNAFRKGMADAAATPDVTPAEKEQWTVVSLEAIDFFDGVLSPPQWKLVKEKAPTRSDLLSNE